MSIRDTAAALGCSTETVRRDEARAIVKLQIIFEVLGEELPQDSPLLTCLRHLAFRRYLERLAACAIGELPADDPPPCPWP